MKRFCFLSLLASLLAFSFPAAAQNNALAFDGVNDYISFSSDPSSVQTIECWVYPSTTSQKLFQLNGSCYVEVISGTLTATGFTSPTLYVNGLSGATAVAQGAWSHIAITTATSINASVFELGRISGSGYLNGKLDEVRLWSDVRSNEEIQAGMYQEIDGSTAGLVAYYKFNQTEGITLTDSKESYHGTLTNMTGGEWLTSPAMFGPKNCLDFNGSSEYGSVPYDISLQNPTFTVEFWMQMNGVTSNFTAILDNGRDAYKNWWFLTKENSLSGVFGVGNGTTSAEIQFNLNDLAWHHVAGVYNGNTAYIYLDGVAIDSVVGAISIIPNDIAIAKRPSSSAYYKGKIDEVRIWSDVRSETEIRENMCKTLVGNENNLVAYYTFDNSSGATLQDLSANTNNATLSGGQWTASTAFNTWLNTSSTSWNTATNWSLGSIPNSSTVNVGIPDHGAANDPNAGTAVEVNNLVLCDDAELTYLGGSHVIHGNVFNIGTTNLNPDTDLTIYRVIVHAA